MHQLKWIFPNQFFRLETERTFHRWTDVPSLSIGIEHRNNFRGILDQRAQIFFALLQRVFRALTIGDVAGNSGEEVLAVFVEFRERQRSEEHTSELQSLTNL